MQKLVQNKDNPHERNSTHYLCLSKFHHKLPFKDAFMLIWKSACPLKLNDLQIDTHHRFTMEESPQSLTRGIIYTFPMYTPPTKLYTRAVNLISFQSHFPLCFRTTVRSGPPKHQTNAAYPKSINIQSSCADKCFMLLFPP